MYIQGVHLPPENLNFRFYPLFQPTGLLHIRNHLVIFAGQKCKVMKTLPAAYYEFSRMILDDHIYEDNSISFPDICAALHVSPGSMNEILEDELGMNGPEILQSFQKLLTL